MRFVVDPQIAPWVGQHFNHEFKGEVFALAQMDDNGQIQAAVVFDQRKYHEINGHIYAPGQLTRPFLRLIHRFPFVHLGVQRINANCRATNLKSRNFLKRLGFTLEGVKRKGYGDGEDMFMFGMLKEECRWIS